MEGSAARCKEEWGIVFKSVYKVLNKKYKFKSKENYIFIPTPITSKSQS
jgi:hypothetical protein